MPTFDKQDLLSDLLDRTDCISSSMQAFRHLSNQQLNYQHGPGACSIAAIFDQLTHTHQTYIDSILAQITKAADTSEKVYKSGWFGDWLYQRTMYGSEGYRMPMAKLAKANSQELDGRIILERFTQQLDTIHDIIRHASTKDLHHIKIPFRDAMQLIKFRLGDNLRYLVANSERHIFQAKQLLAELDPQNPIYRVRKEDKKTSVAK
jgi:DinB superfamily